mmetsp:Transcript_1728/g.4764  ORF Transcript_1728/g.4764 Transcript_1728/m.4764 type:complete len:208 (+) Transcript_1728:2649-3272(+)
MRVRHFRRDVVLVEPGCSSQIEDHWEGGRGGSTSKRHTGDVRDGDEEHALLVLRCHGVEGLAGLLVGDVVHAHDVTLEQLGTRVVVVHVRDQHEGVVVHLRESGLHAARHLHGRDVGWLLGQRRHGRLLLDAVLAVEASHGRRLEAAAGHIGGAQSEGTCGGNGARHVGAQDARGESGCGGDHLEGCSWTSALDSSGNAGELGLLEE